MSPSGVQRQEDSRGQLLRNYLIEYPNHPVRSFSIGCRPTYRDPRPNLHATTVNSSGTNTMLEIVDLQTPYIGQHYRDSIPWLTSGCNTKLMVYKNLQQIVF